MSYSDIMELADEYAIHYRRSEDAWLFNDYRQSLREAIDKLVAENVALKVEMTEQCRIVGMSAERELALQAQNSIKDALLRQALDTLDRLYLPGELERVNNTIKAIKEHLK